MRPNLPGRSLLPRAALLACLATACRLPALAAREVIPVQPRADTSVRRLTLEEARQLALQNNKALALGRLNVEQSGHATAAAGKDYFPKLLGSVTYFHFDRDLGSVVSFQRGKRGILPPGVNLLSFAVLNQNSALSTVFVA